MAQVQTHIADICQRQTTQHKLLNFGICLKAGVTVNLGTDLQGLTGGMQTGRSGLQDTAGIAQSCDGTAIQQMGINAGDLGSHVRAQTHGTTRHLINQFKGAQVRILPCPSQ